MIKKIYLFLITILSALGIYFGFNSTIIPNVVLYIIIAFELINLLLTFIFINTKKKILIGIAIFLSIIIIVVNIALFFVYKRTNTFFDKITNIEYEKSNYAIIALKDSKVEKISDLTSIATYTNELDKNYSLALEELNSKVEVEVKEYKTVIDLITDLFNNKIDAILVNENYIEIIEETNDEFKDKIKIIDTLSIETIKEKKAIEEEIKKLGNFNVYISGIDTYGEISTVSRSDVNILASVDMKNHKILLTNTPRDYYVQLHGTTGSKDKLTHAGVYGIDMSMATIADLYETDINYYVRVNFNSLITLVDAIGGVDVYSDMEFGSGYNHVNYGMNHFDGKQALYYSRQRKIYMEGDRHRGQNQQQVIEAIIKKVTASNDINTYLKLLSTLENSIQTNIDKKMINFIINLQVSNNYSWQIESIQANGYDSSNYTYSYPGQLLYVMEPDYNSLNSAKEKINAYLKSE